MVPVRGSTVCRPCPPTWGGGPGHAVRASASDRAWPDDHHVARCGRHPAAPSPLLHGLRQSLTPSFLKHCPSGPQDTLALCAFPAKLASPPQLLCSFLSFSWTPHAGVLELSLTHLNAVAFNASQMLTAHVTASASSLDWRHACRLRDISE